MSYCGGTVVANSFYSNVLSNGSTASVEYHGQFQNQDQGRRKMRVTVTRLDRIGNFRVLRIISSFDLNPYQQTDVNVLTLHVDNPGGSGAPTPASVGQQLRLFCNPTS